MDQTKPIGGGWHKEVAKTYGERLGGVVVPASHADTRGGRPGLDGTTYLEPPIDDPPMDGELPTHRVKATSVAQPVQMSPAVATVVPVTPVASAIPTLVRVPALPTTGSVKEKVVSDSPVATSPIDINALVDLLKQAGTSPATSGAQVAIATPAVPVSVGTEPPVPSFVEVGMVGPFGRFRTKVADVIICENHVALLYTKHAGDDGLAYEPPLDVPFTLKVPYDNASHREYTVQHFGLITKIRGVGELVVLICTQTADGAEETGKHDQDERDLVGGDTLQHSGL